MAIWNNLESFGLFYEQMVHFVFIWYIFSGFGIMYQEKSGSPGCKKPFLRHLLWRIRGRCYDRNFLRFLPIFGEKIGVFSKKPMLGFKFCLI
jgi:hypothetical protein